MGVDSKGFKEVFKGEKGCFAGDSLAGFVDVTGDLGAESSDVSSLSNPSLV